MELTPNPFQLYDDQRKELEPFINALVERFQPFEIVCFSAVSKDVNISGAFYNHDQKCYNLYALLMIVEVGVDAQKHMLAFVDGMPKGFRVAVLCRNSEDIAYEAKHHRRFINHALRDGILLYDSGKKFYRLTLTKSGFTSRDDYRFHSSIASQYSIAAEKCIQELEYFDQAMLMIYQMFRHTCLMISYGYAGITDLPETVEETLWLCRSLEPELDSFFPDVVDPWEDTFIKYINRAQDLWTNTYALNDVLNEDVSELHYKASSFLAIADYACLMRWPDSKSDEELMEDDTE